ncbi:MAG: peptide ABC transporter substrate-binding protein [Rhodopirellula sp.]|nr:peptide ABC transporter substrate-binding protein [Rhodopirellula sp.]OUX50392.1 MAG: peptide ABC transporter substrate-binding protein [Rhodopirellula sp. TMED283]
MSIRITSLLCLLVIWLTGSFSVRPADAQLINFAQQGVPGDPGLELLQEEPHDLLFFTAKAGGGWAKTLLLQLPGRTMPADRSGSLKLNVLGIEGKDFTAKWSDIEKIDFWELRLERETKERIARGDFKGAYPFMSVLIRDFPNRAGLRELRCEFLWLDAVARAKRKELAPTLAMLEELRRYAPEYKRSMVLGAIDRTTDQLMQQLMDAGDLDLAQKMLARLEKDYANDNLQSIKKWNAEFLRMATIKQNEAKVALDAKDYRAARKLSRESVYLKPDIPGGTELVKLVDRIYPLINVGVLQTATVLEPTRLDNWGARRSGRLLYRTLFEMEGPGPEGGEYDFIFGDVEMSPDRMHFDLLLEPEKLQPPLDKVSGPFLADVMAKRAQVSSGDYFSPWAAAVDSIGLEGPKQVSFNLRRPNVLPTSLLQIPVDGSWFGDKPLSPTGDYRRKEVDDDEVRYVLSGAPKTETQPREIVEIRCASAADAVNLLLQGEVDVLDQLFPADAVRLQRSKSIKVANYPLPTVHMLVPCSDHAYLAERTFRRALLYGINRKDILKGELLEGLEFEGCRVLSGPFPAGIELNDPLGYGYDERIEPRPYEPPLAKLLLAMNTNQMKAMAARKKLEMPDLKPIRLAFPPDNLSRVACEAISTQWKLLGLEVELVQLPVGRTFPDPDEDIADIVYVSAAVWEPIIDARRVLGPEGLAGSQDQLVGLGLRQLEHAKNWREVRDRLLDLHSITHHELPVLPLWQMVESYAYRRELVGMGSDIVSLYQNAGNWRLGQ